MSGERILFVLLSLVMPSLLLGLTTIAIALLCGRGVCEALHPMTNRFRRWEEYL